MALNKRNSESRKCGLRKEEEGGKETKMGRKEIQEMGKNHIN